MRLIPGGKTALGWAFGLLVFLAVGCGDAPRRPNILLIVWDTVRADHLSLYGYEKPTTPFLDEWAREARVFENCISTANVTVPAHTSLFTGYHPSEHGRTNWTGPLDDSYHTLAEKLGAHGYRTYLFSANPLVSRAYNLVQGFDRVEHPWDPVFHSSAVQLDEAEVGPKKIYQAQQAPGEKKFYKGCGALAQQGVEQWLTHSPGERPFFIFLNYMEAHPSCVPGRAYRQRFHTAEQKDRVLDRDRFLNRTRSYTLGILDLSDEELEVYRNDYDAALAELDDYLRGLLASLEQSADLENTLVILTSDHGEHLGERHLLNHQFSVYEPLLRVPLVVHYPAKMAPGREARPVVNFDLFPTLLELARVEKIAPVPGGAQSLLRPATRRLRVGECLDYPVAWLLEAKEKYPTFDPAPYCRTLRAVYDQDHKYIWASDGRHECYDLSQGETAAADLIESRKDLVDRFTELHDAWVASCRKPFRGRLDSPALSKEDQDRLDSLGY